MARLGALLLTLPLVALGCGGSDSPEGPLTCAAGEELFRGRCVDPAARYEPEERLDTDNVSAYGDPLTQITLPDPPKSGFRIIAPPRLMQPGEEIDTCVAWPYPTFQNKIVYSAKIYTTPGLHHSNLIAKPVNPDTGPNPYPLCHPGASDPFADIGNGIPDVLFASSTQIEGGETLTFAPGMGFRLDTTREIVTNIHFLNTLADPLLVEVAYDFFTMSDAELETEVAPFSMQVDDFLIPPHSQGVVESSCATFGGNIVEMLPHTHKLRKSFSVDFIDFQGKSENAITYGAFDTKSEIKVFDPALSIDNVDRIHFSCAFDNTTDHDVKYGLGENEMCILFGYLYPLDAQFVAHAPTTDSECQSIRLGLFH